MEKFMNSDKHFLYCHEHQGIVSLEDIDFETGELTGHDFPECKIHPDATYEVFSINQIKEKFGFTMFENRNHLQ